MLQPGTVCAGKSSAELTTVFNDHTFFPLPAVQRCFTRYDEPKTSAAGRKSTGFHMVTIEFDLDKKWSEEEDQALKAALQAFGPATSHRWDHVAADVASRTVGGTPAREARRTAHQCEKRAGRLQKARVDLLVALGVGPGRAA